MTDCKFQSGMRQKQDKNKCKMMSQRVTRNALGIYCFTRCILTTPVRESTACCLCTTQRATTHNDHLNSQCKDPVKMSNDPQWHQLTPREVLEIGLKMMYETRRINNVEGDPWTSTTNSRRFKAHCGANCVVVSVTWRDLHTTESLPDGHDKNAKLSITELLKTFNFLHRCHRELEREATFDKSPKTLRRWCWCCVRRMQALKADKIKFPTDAEMADDDWIMTVDGVHCAINEPSHLVFSKDKKCHSHKKKRAGLCCELGVSLFENRLMWLNGPFPAGGNDNGNFKQGGLKQKLMSTGKRALADKIHNGHPEEVSTFNAFDDPAVKAFKSRAQMRHEQFNGMLREFASLDDRFRHGEEKFGLCFDSVCVICQCRLENGEPLFDLLAGIQFEEQ